MLLKMPTLPGADELAAMLRAELGEDGIDDLILKYIQRDPNRGGIGNVIVRDYWISVWALIPPSSSCGGEMQAVADDYQIPLEHVRAALAFYARFPEAIIVRLDGNSYFGDEAPLFDRDNLGFGYSCPWPGQRSLSLAASK